MNLAHQKNIVGYWQERLVALKKRGVTLVSFGAERIRQHINPHFQSTPLGKSRFILKQDESDPPQELMKNFLKAADSIIMSAFLKEKEWNNADKIELDLPISELSDSMIGLDTILDLENRFFLGDHHGAIFTYPVLYPKNSGFYIDTHSFCVTQQADMPRTEQFRIAALYKKDREWGLDVGSIDTVQETQYLKALTIFPSAARPATNQPEPKFKSQPVRLLTPEEAIMLQEMGNKIVSIRATFENSGMLEHSSKFDSYRGMIERSNPIIDASLG